LSIAQCSLRMKKPTHKGRLFHSPDKSIGRTFRVVFEFPPEFNGKKAVNSKPSRTYKNPVFLALEWEKALETGNYPSQTALARELGISRVRVTQVLNLLRLAPEVLEQIAGLGDPLASPTVTERKLRPLVNLPRVTQSKRIQKLLGNVPREKSESH